MRGRIIIVTVFVSLIAVALAVLLVGAPTVAAQIGATLTPTRGGGPTRTPLLPILITATPPGTPPPPPTSTVYPLPAPECAAPLPFSFGQRVVLTPGINVRSLPSLSGAVVNYYTEEVVLTILDGPVCAFGYNWWRVGGVGEPGWVIEGRPDRYFLGAAAVTPLPTATLHPLTPTATPTIFCHRPLRLGMGTRAAVTYRDGVPRTLRAAPTVSGAALQSLIAGVAFDIIGGPICADGYNWWNVQIVGTTLTGWLAEGLPGNYWFEIVIEVPPGG
ncbi:MAG: hypothetical protein NZM00_13745 [Anaerolinea sp.]|nr:hypothetical protein [Anaerolinea sp.]